MNNEEAIRWLKALKNVEILSATKEALGIAIKRLEEIPQGEMTTKEAIRLLQLIEEDGRNVTKEHIEALNLAIKAFEFIEQNVPSTFNDYLNGITY